ncbi:hypothetical protein FSP39_010966 [Pinctada imbricata]|uniref:Harmonin-binding protein USHBP1 PDZ-binding domain-containing protein n=1 Tax=Pinctada imbricata TaxID=66713 RepID=A0AA88XV69_PINIB|nr:hypothetical protein FSP39_010966 [Pinctada imbricata]
MSVNRPGFKLVNGHGVFMDKHEARARSSTRPPTFSCRRSWSPLLRNGQARCRTNSSSSEADAYPHGDRSLLYRTNSAASDTDMYRNISLVEEMSSDRGRLYLHLAALTSLKGEIIEQSNRLKHVTNERDVLEKQLNRTQTDKLRLQREFEDRLEQITVRYEERVTELHSVIAELRKKIERHQINVIREEEEYEEDAAAHSTKSNDGGSHHANDSQANSLDILGNDLNSEISRVVTELESAIDERKKSSGQVDEACNTDNVPEQNDSDSVEEKALEACKQVEVFEFEECTTPPLPPPRGLRPATFHPPPPPPPNEFPEPAYLQEEINSLRQDCGVLHETVQKQESELNLHKAAVGSLREERDRLRKKVQELHGILQHYDIQLSSPQHSRTATPTKAPTQHNADNRSQSSNEAFPVAKVAELKKLKTCANDRPVLGPEISSSNQLPNTKVAEHLVQGLQECSNMQEIVQTIYTSGSEMTDSKVQEFEIEFERLQSKIDNLKSQNDLLALTLEESKSQSDRLSVLIGKYESNNTALQLAVNYSDQAIEAYDVLLALIESELGLVLTNSRVLGVSGGHRNFAQNPEEIAQLTQRSRNSRKIAENVAKHLLQKLDRNYMSTASNPWEELSSTNRTASSHGSSSGCSSEDFNKADEQRLREFIQQVKSDRAAVKSTVMELESLHLDSPSVDSGRGSDGPRIDLENAVLMQELMAMKEEKTELKAQNYIIEKEKRAIELRLSGKESQEQAYMIQIEHLKAEVAEKDQLIHKDPTLAQVSIDDFPSTFTMGECRSHDPVEITIELNNALKREKKLKARVQELVIALEKLSRNSEIRHQQSAEFVNDLKRANSALIAAFDKAKKKYQGKLKKLEVQIQSLTERYEGQVCHCYVYITILSHKAGVPHFIIVIQL